MKSSLFTAAVLTVASFTAQAETTASSCIPSFVKVGDKYFMSFADKEHHVKVTKFESGTCWVKVKEILPVGVDANTLPAKRRNAYWVNMSDVSVVRKN